MIELGVNVPTLTAPGQPPVVIDRAISRLHELGVSHVRLPLQWRVLQDGRGDPRLDGAAVERIESVLERLDPSIAVLAIVTKPPVEEVVRYFDDQSEFAGRYGEYVRQCARAFGRVDDWEVWNEPNASDFYLSVGEGDGQRPWSPEEFLEHAWLPAVKVLRAERPDDGICMGAVAENGLVGHDDRPAAPSNLLPDEPRFMAMRDPGPHSRFYFEPGFARGLLAGIEIMDGRDRPDAIAFHPYPYFQLKPGEDHLAHSRALSNEILALVPDDVGVWVTEVGARSLRMPGGYVRDDAAQADFFEGFTAPGALRRDPERVYWYKLLDRVRDLRMEKTFGLLDFEGSPRRVFHVMRRTALPARRPGPIVEGFDWATTEPVGVVDQTIWDEEISGPYGFADHISGAAGSELVVSPGRFEGDSWGLVSKPVVGAGPVEVIVEFETLGPPIPLEVHLLVDGKPSARVDIDSDGVSVAGEIVGQRGERVVVKGTAEATTGVVGVRIALRGKGVTFIRLARLEGRRLR